MTRRLRRPALAALLLILVAVATGVAVYRFTPAAWTVDAGGPLSGTVLHGVYADEIANGERYRWTTGHAVIDFPDLGADMPVVVGIRAGTRPPESPATITFTVTTAAGVRTIFTQTRDAAIVWTPPITRPPGESGLVLTVDVPTFRPPGDSRALGLKLERLHVEPAPGAGPPNPPLDVLVWLVLITCGITALIWGALRRPVWAGLLGLGALALAATGLVAVRPLVTPWLPAAGAAAAGLGLLALAWPGLRRWPASVDALAAPRAFAPVVLLAAALVLYAAFALSVLPAVDWIGHADYADNAVVARNLVDGRGAVVDYAAQFYQFYPGITHAADTWPLLQPLLIAPFFWLFGTDTWIAKLPNLFLLLLLAGTVYRFAAGWWDRRVGLLGALLTLLHPYFFQTVLYPINDLAFTLLTLLTIGWAVDALGPAPRVLAPAAADPPPAGAAAPPAAEPAPAEPAEPPVLRDPRRRRAVLAGLAGGLLVWSKGPSALLLLGALGLALLLALLTTRWAGRRPRRDWGPWAWAAGAGLLVLLPLLARNLLTFHTPFYSTEQFDTWILRFYTGGTGLPWEHIYANYLTGQPLPDRSLLLRSFDALYAAVAWGFTSLWRSGILGGDILPLPLVVAGLAGWLLAPPRLRRLRLAWLAAFALYGLGMLLVWHYEARYFLAVVPWFYVGVAALLFWIWDRLRGNRLETAVGHGAAIGEAPAPSALRRAPAALAILPLAVAALVVPQISAIGQTAASDSGPDSFATAGRWVAAHLPGDAVVMTRNPWEFNWYGRRKAVMIPEGSLADVQAIVARYGVSYLWVGGRGDSASLRPQLAPLYRGQALAGFPATPVYTADGITIYRLGR